MAAKPSRPKGARPGRVVFGSVGLAGSAAIVMALGPVWTPMPVSADVLATPMRAVENAELAAAAEAETVTRPTTAPPAPTTLPPEPELIIVEVHRRVAAGTPGAAGTAPVVSDPGSPVVGSAAPTAGAAPSPAQAQTSATAPTPAPAAAEPAAPAPAPVPARTAAPAPPPPPPPAPTAPPRTSSSG